MLLCIGTNNSLYWISFLASIIFCAASTIACCFLPEQHSQTEEPPQERQAELPWRELFKPRFRKVLLNAFLMGIAQQATGINSVIIYATATFQTVFSDDPNDYYSPIYGSLLISCVNFVSTLIALPFINRLGRRILWFGGYAICAVAMVLFIIYYSNDISSSMLIVTSILFLFGFEIGPGPCFYVLCGEIFPQIVRAKCSGIAFTMNWIVNIIVVMIFPFFEGIEWAAYVTYLVLMIIPVIILWFVTPETKGKSLTEIENIMIVPDNTENESDMLVESQ